MQDLNGPASEFAHREQPAECGEEEQQEDDGKDKTKAVQLLLLAAPTMSGATATANAGSAAAARSCNMSDFAVLRSCGLGTKVLSSLLAGANPWNRSAQRAAAMSTGRTLALAAITSSLVKRERNT
eukprot:CAMPEP_0175659890 /NCGR_PEP_ID=MMETSP0097-20121207/14163_1 /TAXON_ID=311494 /ORGANISM="Alexandrium monilatum, Strain CCMP3105" /LENGTH=125 /DNA_ID=CAMNT_0016966019 /DNA_START=132 /DNA_END=510 /DNA_ORIENTATION=-